MESRFYTQNAYVDLESELLIHKTQKPFKRSHANIVYIAPGGVLKPHKHENEEVYIILEGSGIGYFGLKNPVEIKKDMFLHFPSNAIHGVKKQVQQ
ncbi:MAG: hypothetical protein CM1200mP37_6770 [Chloroflexota bacterium]|nr:MAG: hypothetical protein CM1200mP37_6770 [Chloroflexota bacterium]